MRLISLALAAILVVALCEASDDTGSIRMRADASTGHTGSSSNGEWKLILYTGNKLWAGTDSDLYVELIGSNGNSKIIRLQPGPSQLEADDIDEFSLGNLANYDIGVLKSIVIAKQHSYAFFNDWELVKAEVIDPNGRKYVLKCNCWLTTLKYKRLINVSEVVGERPSSLDGTDDPLTIGGRHTRVFPLTITILLLLLVLITFTYFGNEILKKWRENFLMFNSSMPRVNQFPINILSFNTFILDPRPSGGQSSSNHRSGGVRSRSPRGEVGSETTGVARDPEHAAVNVLLNPNIQLNSSIIEDKPPDYKALFPQHHLAHEMVTLSNESRRTDSSGGVTVVDTVSNESNTVSVAPAESAVVVVVVDGGNENRGGEVNRDGRRGEGGEDTTSQHKLTAV